MKKIKIIGAGLAGAEAAWQAAAAGCQVELWEMRQARRSPAHSTDYFAELVCSNSLRAAGLTNADVTNRSIPSRRMMQYEQ